MYARVVICESIHHSAMHKNTRILNAAIRIEHSIFCKGVYNDYNVYIAMNSIDYITILYACWMLQLFLPIYIFPPNGSKRGDRNASRDFSRKASASVRKGILARNSFISAWKKLV